MDGQPGRTRASWRIFIIAPNIAFFCAGLSLIISTTHTMFTFPTRNSNYKQKDEVLQESHIAFGVTIAAGSILCLISILFCCQPHTWKVHGKRWMTLEAYAIAFILVIVLEIVGTIFAFKSANHIETLNEYDEYSVSDGSKKLYTLGIILAVFISIEGFLVFVVCAIYPAWACYNYITSLFPLKRRNMTILC